LNIFNNTGTLTPIQ